MRNLRTEEEIIANWKGDIEKPVVSIGCITFNHEFCIKDALEGFLIQETDFPFEILIHDDASTDKTADIIREYVEKYPKLIKPILQTENKYSQGIKINPTYNFPRAKGEYIALCEGDDYWITVDKLQVQIDAMREYPNINISFHPAYQVNGHVLNKSKVFCDYSNEIKVFTTEEVILGGGGFMPTASLIMKKEAVSDLPNWFYQYAPVGDMYLQAISSIKNGALFLPLISSVYRVNVQGSWTNSQKKSTRLKIKENAYSNEKCLIALNESSGGLYQKVFNIAIARELTFCSLNSFNNEYYDLCKELINKSVIYKYGINKEQVFLKLFCNQLRLLKFFLKIKKKIII